MIQELVHLSARLREDHKGEKSTHDALDKVPVTIDCVIDKKGGFKQFEIVPDRKVTLAERVPAKKGQARLLLDRAEEVLGIVLDAKKAEETKKKHKRFLEKLTAYGHLKQLAPAMSFYKSNKTNGIERARKRFFDQVGEKERIGNIAFRLFGESRRLHEQDPVYEAIIGQYGTFLESIKNSRFERCSVCGSTSHPVADKPHGMIKGVPGQPRRDRAFVSYNKDAFESYGMKGNENSSVCTHCAKGYVDGLNWLLAPRSWKPSDKKGKNIPIFKNKRDISEDTAVVFWLRNAVDASLLDVLDKPTEAGVQELFDSVFKGWRTTVTHVDPDTFYAITLSSAAARIAVRDWIETSLLALRTNLAEWFQDIEISQYDPETKAASKQFPRFSTLVWNVKSKGTKDVQYGRIGAALWKCALTGTSPPLWMMSSVLSRIRTEQSAKSEEGRKRTPWEIKLPARIAILKLCLNRKADKQGGIKYMATLDESNKNVAYVCGRLFAVLESIQYHASGGNLNAGIRERFFSFASTMPSTAFGRLMKLSQHHLSKIRGKNQGLAVNLDKKLQELMCKIQGTGFPAVFSLEDQGSFAIGYYHQRQEIFDTKSISKEE